jgi:hypothetical protein
MEVLADDELDLPERLPGQTNHEQIRRLFAPCRKSNGAYAFNKPKR